MTREEVLAHLAEMYPSVRWDLVESDPVFDGDGNELPHRPLVLIVNIELHGSFTVPDAEHDEAWWNETAAALLAEIGLVT